MSTLPFVYYILSIATINISNMSRLLAFMCFALSLGLSVSATNFNSSPFSQPQHVFLLAGQSNMVGRGGIPYSDAGWNQFVPSECQPNPSIWRLNPNLIWSIAKEPIHAGIYRQPAGIGPAMPFANSILSQFPAFGTIGLVPCAKDGSSIRGWQKTGKELYLNLIRRAQAAVRDGGKIEALLWWQGGADAKVKEVALKYQAELSTFFLDLRADLGLPELKIIQVIMPKGREKEAPYTDIIRKAQETLNVSNVYNIDPGRLPLNPDEIHVTTKGQITVGHDFAKMFLRIRNI